MQRELSALVLTWAALALAGCAGEPPSISNFTLSPVTIAAGEQTQVHGEVDFEDPDGDVADVVFGITFEGEDAGETSQPVAGAEGLTAGRALFIVALQPPEPGEIELSVRLVDEEGNESNTLSAIVTAE